MLVILNNRIASGRLQTDTSDNLDVPRSPGGGRSVFTVPSARHAGRAGGSSIIVTKDRLIFRLDSDMNPRVPPSQSMSDGDLQSTKESARSSNPVYVSNILAMNSLGV